MQLKGRVSLLLAAGVTSALLFAGTRLDPVSAQDNSEEEQRPFTSSLVETTEVSLILLDVVVTDRQGRPMPGLTKDDFVIKLDGRAYPIYSVDDLCGCVDESEGAESIEDRGQPPGEARSLPSNRKDRHPRRSPTRFPSFSSSTSASCRATVATMLWQKLAGGSWMPSARTIARWS
jgi:hypothetical protein